MRSVLPLGLAAFAVAGSITCRPAGLGPREGFVGVPGGRVWYRIVGSGMRTPLLVLHGGPGVPSTYLKPLAALADERPVVFYDQLGTGKSDHPTDTSLWRMDRYVDELARVRKALGLHDVFLYGHSWGTIVATEYLLSRPSGVRGVIFAGPVLSMARYRHDDDSLKGTLPEPARTTILSHERAGTCDSPDYQAALMSYYGHFFAHHLPLSADLDSSTSGVDPASAVAMFGPCGRSGALSNYDGTARIGEITVPTLFLVGRVDPSTPATTRYYQSLMPGSEVVVFDSSGHLPMQDEPARYLAAIHEFLTRIERP